MPILFATSAIPGFQLPVESLFRKLMSGARETHQHGQAACAVEPAQLPGYTDSKGSDTIYLSAIDKDGNIVSLIQSNYWASSGSLRQERASPS
jgi:gamma-glutamyltranspeptidase/glutathione hydrolase